MQENSFQYDAYQPKYWLYWRGVRYNDPYTQPLYTHMLDTVIPHKPSFKQTSVCENITLPHTLYAVGKSVTKINVTYPANKI